MQDLEYGLASGISEDPDSTCAWLLPVQTVGSKVKHLTCRFVDEVGRPAAPGARGKIVVRDNAS